MRLVECVPNFSEGRNKSIIGMITGKISEVEGVKLLDVDPGAETNRTVVTFVGTPEGVKEAAFRAIAKAAELIDMRKHSGAHARMGATDVCPFVPVTGVTVDECVQISHEVAKRVGEELKIPVYLYEHSAQKEDRQNLASIRTGEYEGLAEKLKDPEWEPDYGPAEFNEQSGATVMGAREFLIAFNVNVNAKFKKPAHQIALNIREKGRAKRDENGKIVRDENGKKTMVPGRLKGVKGVGWYIPEYKQAQVSMNLVNYHVTPPHMAYEAIREEAEKQGVVVTGSELVGLIPKEAMLMAGRYFLEKQGQNTGVPELDLIECAILSMGLDAISPFDSRKKIIEYQVAPEGGALVDLSVTGFADEVSRDSAAPGGGSVAALAGSLAAGLSSMVASLTHLKKGFNDVWDEMKQVAVKAQPLKDFFLKAIDDDTQAFNNVMKAFRMKAKTDEAKLEKQRVIEEANKKATLIPLGVLEKIPEVLELSRAVAERGNPNSVSDAGVSALMALAAADGAFYNVKINLGGIDDEVFRKEITEKAEKLRAEVKQEAEKIDGIVMQKLEE